MEHRPRAPRLGRTIAVACTVGALGAVLVLQPVAASADVAPTAAHEGFDVVAEEVGELRRDGGLRMGSRPQHGSFVGIRGVSTDRSHWRIKRRP